VAHTNPPQTVIRDLLVSARHLAIVGASSSTDRPSYQIARKLQSAGYRILPVNPNEREVLGERAYRSLDEVPEPVDIVVVFRRPEYTPRSPNKPSKRVRGLYGCRLESPMTRRRESRRGSSW